MSSLVLVAKRLPVKAFVIGVLLLCISNALASTIDLQQAAFGTVDVSRYSTWDLGAEPNPNSTSRWVFDTVNSLLQHWPNTRYRNGHNFVPGLVPVGTLLYHGTRKHEIPKIPEWTATDPDHAFPFSRPRDKSSELGGYFLTLVATRPLRVLYFDGSSAANMWGGSLDTQDTLIWGGPQLNRTLDEWRRAQDICEWGKKYDIDGFVRMEMNFEVVLCDFSSGVEVVSFLNTDAGSSGAEETAYHILESGFPHNHFPGELRIKLDYSRIVSFYDTSIFPGGQSLRWKKDRWDHNLLGITSSQIDTFHQALDVALKGEWGNPRSGIDWKTLFAVVTDRYAERLELLNYILNGTSITRESSPEALLKSAQRHTKSMLTPYILHSLYPPPKEIPSSRQWAEPIFEMCATTHVRYIEKSSHLRVALTSSEVLLLAAVKDVSKEICRVLVGLWAEGANRGLAEYSDLAPPDTRDDEPTLAELLEDWRTRVASLMKWLDWSHWVRCDPACKYEEVCYLPTWPFFKRWPPGPRPGGMDGFVSPLNDSDGIPGPDDDWYHPTPRCIRRIEPFTL